MILFHKKLYDMKDNVVGCISMRILDKGKSYGGGDPLPPDVNKRRFSLVQKLEASWGIKIPLTDSP